MVRVGAIDFLNAAPLCSQLPRDHERWQIVEGMPSELASALRCGEIDVGLVPQVEACFDADYRIVDGHCISCDGEVGSILLFERKPWQQLERVAADRASNSSIALLQVLRHLDGLAPLEIVESRSDLSLLEKSTTLDAVLLIGDAALKHRKISSLERTDLGMAWKQRTDLPFVFAIWLARSGLPPWVSAELASAARSGISEVERIADQYSSMNPDVLDFAEARDYLSRCIRYDLGEAEKQSMTLFHRFRAELDRDIDRSWQPRYLEVNR